MATVSIEGLPAQETVPGGTGSPPFAGVVLSDPDYATAATGGETATITDADPAMLTLYPSFTDGSTSTVTGDGAILTIENADPQALTETVQGLTVLPALALESTETTVPLSFTFTFTSGDGGGTVTAKDTLTVPGTIQPLVLDLSNGAATFGATFSPFATATLSSTFGDAVSIAVSAQNVQGAFDLSSLPYPSAANDTGGATLAGTADQVQADLRALQYTARSTAGGSGTVYFQLQETVGDGSSQASEYTTLAPAQASPVVLIDQAPADGLSVGAGQDVAPFADTSFSYAGDPDTPLTAVITSGGAAGSFDLAALGTLAGVSASESSDGGTVTLTADASLMQQALDAVAFTTADDTAITAIGFGLTVSDGAGDAASLQQAVQVLPPYVVDATDDSWSVTGVSGTTATIDLTAHPGAFVFGGNAFLNLTDGQNTTVVLNGAGTGGADIDATGQTVVWTGAETTGLTGSGTAEILMGATAGQSGYLDLEASAGSADQVVVLGSAGTTQTVTTFGPVATIVFGGASSLDFQGDDTTLVLNGVGVTGITDVTGGDGNTIWAGQSALSYAADGGSDTLILTETTTASVFGSTRVASGTTTILDLGGASSLTVVGGEEAEHVDVANSHATVFGRAGNQTLSLNGAGSLEAVDTATATGTQDIAAAAGSLTFFGGANAAVITLGTGNTTLIGGTGSLSLDLSRAAATVATIDGDTSGMVDVTGYDPTRATVHLSSYASQYVSQGSTVFVLNDGHTGTFYGYASRS